MQDYKIIYIAGYGRSGSTLLDVILGNTGHSQSCGEINTIFDEYINGEKCSCGASYDNCPVWSKFFSEIDHNEKIEEYRKNVRNIDKRETVFRPWEKNISFKEKGLYKDVNKKLFGAISNEGTQFIVDSSKTAADGSFRPVALQELAGLDVKVIHIQRKLADVIKSLKKGSNRAMQQKKDVRLSLSSQIGLSKKSQYIEGAENTSINVIRGIVGYFLANRDATKLKKRLGEENYIKIAFEELLQSPEATLSAIEQQFDLDLLGSKNKIDQKQPLGSGHAVGGNRMIQNKTIIFGAQ